MHELTSTQMWRGPTDLRPVRCGIVFFDQVVQQAVARCELRPIDE